ncbi:hypothetical protein DFJ73DRAFT_803666 [Zopfochytrium polystomum]|nr:hypothetical protein DFJ73DRAFT_803666 [Zopfochytrium polystomum]
MSSATAARSTAAAAVEAAWASDNPTYQPQMTAALPPLPPAEPPYQVDFNDRQARCYNFCVASLIVAVSPVMLPCILMGCCLRPQRATIDDAAIRYNDEPPVQLQNVSRVALWRNVCCGCVEAPLVKAVLRDGRVLDGGATDTRVELTSRSAWATSTWAMPLPGSVTLDRLEDGDTHMPVTLAFDELAAAAHLTEVRHQRCVIDDRSIRLREVSVLHCFGHVAELWIPLDRVSDVVVSAPCCAGVVAAAPDVRNVIFTVEGVTGPENNKAFTAILAVRSAAAVKELIEERKRALQERISLISTAAEGHDDDDAAATAIGGPPKAKISGKDDGTRRSQHSRYSSCSSDVSSFEIARFAEDEAVLHAVGWLVDAGAASAAGRGVREWQTSHGLGDGGSVHGTLETQQRNLPAWRLLVLVDENLYEAAGELVWALSLVDL